MIALIEKNIPSKIDILGPNKNMDLFDSKLNARTL
jgi:hypothetical protein